MGAMPAAGIPPTSSPMATPQPGAGLAQAARTSVQAAIDVLQQALPALGATSDEGQAVLNALKTLTKSFGRSESKNRELMPAEIMQLLAGLPKGTGGPVGAPSPMMPKPPGAAGAAPPPV